MVMVTVSIFLLVILGYVGYLLYASRNTTPKISFEEWNGDRLAQVILDGILREELLPAPQRSHLRKAVAMVEEPDIALDHFHKLLRILPAHAPNFANRCVL